MASEEEQSQKVTVSREETELVFCEPAISANKFYVHTGGPGVRLTFAELSPESQPFVRSSVLMHPRDAIALRDLLSRMLIPFEERTKEDGEKDGE